MKKMILLGAMLLAGAGTVAVANEGMSCDCPTTAPTTAPTTQAAKPINKYCAVEGEGNAVDPDVTVVYNGQVIGFCCSDCVAEFQKDPEKYIKNLK